ncbi:mRNA surveillance protein pelota [Candidatus Woesearchaeota archaeon]|nr:mRNA surveillance protein pelota [Candidatus Woesearchaeota archaeon]
MHLIHSDFKKGLVKLRLTEPEDLWYLSQLIDPGDLLTGKATRKIKIGTGENASTTKRTFTATIEAETIECSDTAVRVNGKLREEPEDIPKGSYQAIALEETSEFVLQKSSWAAYQKQKLQEATEKKYTFLLCLLDREEALMALTKKSGYEVLLQLHGDVPKKMKGSQAGGKFQEEIIAALDTYAGRYTPDKIILASPVFYKEDLLQKISAPTLREKIVLASCSDVSIKSLDEVMTSPALAQTLHSSRLRQDKVLVDELLHEISKDNLAIYGWKEVQTAVHAGAVRILLCTDGFIRIKRQENAYEPLDQLLKKVDALKGTICILSSADESGKTVDGVGGIAALLRYKMEW